MPQYTRNPPLDESALDPDPLRQFERWLDEAQQEGFYEPTAMALATATRDGAPSVRMVLYKGLFDGGLCFYTNYESRKGRELAENPRAAAVFWWDRMERQLRVEGSVERLPRAQSEAYFHSRPRESQLAALTSHQSRVVGSREELDARYAENARRHADGEVPCPPYWGGYRIVPVCFEFWQGRRGRFHDRIRYRRDGGRWLRERLEP